MTITLTQAIHESGAVVSAGTTITRAADVEADLVARGFATPVGLAPGVAGVGANIIFQMAAAYRPAALQGFVPRLLSSLVASSTASCTSGVVTVTATSHAIPATVFDGYSFYYPGSPSLAAGWYSGFSRTGVNTLTFLAPSSADFGSESVNAGDAFTYEVTYESIVIPANMLRVGDRVTIPTFRASNNPASTKTVRMKIGSNSVNSHVNTSTTTLTGPSDFSFTIDSATTAVGHGNMVGTLASTLNRFAADISADLTISLTGQISAAGVYMSLLAAKITIE